MIGGVIGGDRHAGFEFGESGARAEQGVGFGSLDIHLDVIDALEFQLISEFINGGEGDALDVIPSLFVDDKAVGGRVGGVNVELQDVVLVPDALGVDDDTAGGDFAGKVAAKAFDVLGSRFDGDDFGGPGAESVAGEDADVRSAIENDFTRLDAMSVAAVDVARLFGEIEGQNVLATSGDPIPAVRRVVEEKPLPSSWSSLLAPRIRSLVEIWLWSSASLRMAFAMGQAGLRPRRTQAARRAGA